MERNRQDGHTPSRMAMNALALVVCVYNASERSSKSTFGNSILLSLYLLKCLELQELDNVLYEEHKEKVKLTSFTSVFQNIAQSECVRHFRCTKQDVLRLVPVFGWPPTQTCTARNRYSVTPLLATCVCLKRLSAPFQWREVELLFGKFAPQLSEIFWESIERMIALRINLITGDLDKSFSQGRLHQYADAVSQKLGTQCNCIGFIDGTNLFVARPAKWIMQNVLYNGHKRRHALKYQALTAADGLVLHVAGPIEGRRHDWTLYCASGLDEQLEQLLFHEGEQVYVYGDPAYTERDYLLVPFAGTALTPDQAYFNKMMATVRITVEWFFRDVKQYWTTMDFKRKLIINQAPIGSLYLASLLLTNFLNCLYHNRISQYFDCSPPTLEEYVNHKL